MSEVSGYVLQLSNDTTTLVSSSEQIKDDPSTNRRVSSLYKQTRRFALDDNLRRINTSRTWLHGDFADLLADR